MLRVPVVNGVSYRGWGTIEDQNVFSELPLHDVEEFEVRTVCPDLMALGDVGLIKIDVEGHELDVLAGISGLLAKCRPNVLIEIGDAQRGGSLAEVRGRFEQLGYIGFTLVDRILRVLPRTFEVRGSINVIFISVN